MSMRCSSISRLTGRLCRPDRIRPSELLATRSLKSEGAGIDHADRIVKRYYGSGTGYMKTLRNHESRN